MFTHMDADHSRFRKIVRGKIKQNLKKYISGQDLVAQIGDMASSGKPPSKITVPLPHIELPRFAYGQPEEQEGPASGVGQGKGDVGTEVEAAGRGDDEGDAAGSAEGNHTIEEEVSLDDLAEMLTDSLELPCIERKGPETLQRSRRRFSSVSSQGPRSLHHVRRTYKAALKRSIASGLYDPEKPVVVPIRDDQRFRSDSEELESDYNAVVVYMMDVSGSMGEEQKEWVRLTSFWIDAWLSREYEGIERRYIVHDAVAREVSQYEFYRTKENGGTLISSAYHKAVELLEQSFPPSQWNVYLFHFSDGDNWSVNDTRECFRLLETALLPAANLFCYGQTRSQYGSGQFLNELQKYFQPLPENIVTQNIPHRDAIVDTLKAFLGTGK